MALIYYQVSWRRRGMASYMGTRTQTMTFRSSNEALHYRNQLMVDPANEAILIRKIEYGANQKVEQKKT